MQAQCLKPWADPVISLLSHLTPRQQRHCADAALQGSQWDERRPSHRQLGPQLRAALTRMHQHGIVHRDIRPENVMVDDASGRPVFGDLALAAHAANGEDFELEDASC